MPSLPEPPGLAARPHWGKFPIPFVTHVGLDGRPDFRVHEELRRRKVALCHLCQLCGADLGREFVFIGTPPMIQAHRFGEPPMHRECMEYAWAICPWLTGGGERRDIVDDAITVTAVPTDDETLMGIYPTNGYSLERGDEGQIIWKAWEPVEAVEFRGRHPA